MVESKRYMSNIIGNEALCSRLGRDVESNSLSHAYIIEGPRGSGRSTVALLAAAATACEYKKSTSYPLPCMSCPACKKILECKSPDVIFIDTDGKATLGVETARFIKEDVYITPNDLDDKFYIIKNADKMTAQAQNAILLTLEEPPAFVHFFLICESASALLETIRSRAPTLRTSPLDDALLDGYLTAHSAEASSLKSADSLRYRQLMRAAGGSIGRATELLSGKSREALYEQRQLADALIKASAQRAGAAVILPLISSFSSKRDVFAEQLGLLSDALRDLIMLKCSENATLTFYATAAEALEVCDSIPTDRLTAMYNAVCEAIEENRRNGNVRLICIKLAVNAQIL